MPQKSENIFYELPEIIQEAVIVLAIPTSLNESIAEQLLRSTQVTNGNTTEVIRNLKTFPIWVKRTKTSWCIDDEIRDIAIQKLNDSTLETKRKVIEVLKEYETTFKNQTYLVSRDFQLQLVRLSLGVPEEQQQSIQKLRSFFEAAELFNNHEASRVLSSYIDENLKIDNSQKSYPVYILSAYFIKGIDAYRKREFKVALEYLLPVWKYYDRTNFSSQKDAAIASHFAGLIYAKERSQFKNAEDAFNDSLKISSEINLNYHIAQVYHSIGNLYIKQKKYPAAERAFLQSLELRNPKTDSYGLAQVYHSLGNLYSKDRHRFIEAEDMYRKSLSIELRNNNQYGIAQVFHSLGRLYSKDFYRFKDAEEAFNKSIDHRFLANDFYGLAQTYHSLGILYSKDKSRYEDAEKALFESLQLEKKNNNKYGQAIVYNVLGILYSKDSNKYQKAEDAYLKSLEIAFEIRNNSCLAQTFANYGRLMLLTKNYQKAKSLFEEALKYENDFKFITTIKRLIQDLPL